jgi:hypothetical protein
VTFSTSISSFLASAWWRSKNTPPFSTARRYAAVVSSFARIASSGSVHVFRPPLSYVRVIAGSPASFSVPDIFPAPLRINSFWPFPVPSTPRHRPVSTHSRASTMLDFPVPFSPMISTRSVKSNRWLSP